MSVEFVEGKCCGDCAKCQLPQRPRSQQGMQACAIANILPMVFCTHDLVIEQNALIAKLTKIVKKQSEEVNKLLAELAGKECACESVDDNNGNGNGNDKPKDNKEKNAEEESVDPEEGEENKPEAKRLPKTKKV